ncbi:hypothetical protein ACFVJ3_30370 [Rhodococcus sp. NPDC127593]|uniref:hypothetical protein n=1 Tax=Rhodococcus sp. NPDC127593 TaxID=3345404 RepID=UPI00363BF231
MERFATAAAACEAAGFDGVQVQHAATSSHSSSRRYRARRDDDWASHAERRMRVVLEDVRAFAPECRLAGRQASDPLAVTDGCHDDTHWPGWVRAFCGPASRDPPAAISQQSSSRHFWACDSADASALRPWLGRRKLAAPVRPACWGRAQAFRSCSQRSRPPLGSSKAVTERVSFTCSPDTTVAWSGASS